MKNASYRRRVLAYALIVGILVMSNVPATVQAAAPPIFSDVTDAAGLYYRGETWGWAWGDYDDDTYLDLFLGNHPDLTNGGPDPSSFLMQNNQDGTFTDVLGASGISATEDRHDHAWIDYDDDGDLDLWISVGGRGGEGEGPSQLFRQGPTGTFVDVAPEAGIDYPMGRGRGTAWFDYDFDGDLDLYYTGALSDVAPNALFRNNGDGTFDNVTSELSLDSFLGAQSQAAVMDYDGDGDEDLYATGYSTRLYRNDGGQFSSVGVSAGVYTTAAQSADWGDYDNDGDMDLFVARGTLPDGEDYWEQTGNVIEFSLQASLGDEDGLQFVLDTPSSVTFELVGQRGGVTFDTTDAIFIGPDGSHPPDNPFTLDETDIGATPPYTVGVDSGYFIWQPTAGEWHVHVTGALERMRFSGIITATSSYDSIGDTDLEPPIATSYPNRLFRNDGDGTFTDVSTAAGVDDPQDCRGADWGDYDNDGDLDLFVQTAGMIATNAPDLLYENNGDGTFTEVASLAVISGTDQGYGWGGGWGDYDNDGNLDLLAHHEGWPWPLDEGRYQLFHNEGGTGNHWLEVDLRGVESNSRGYGAKVWITTAGVTQFRPVHDGSHYFYHYTGPIHVGLGANTEVDEIRVLWPSGIEQTLTEIAADQRIVITEEAPSGMPEADLEISKTDSADPAVAGQDLTYTVTVLNNGPDTALDVVIADELPTEVGFVSATPASCYETNGVVTCDLGDLVSGASVDATIVVTTPMTTGILTNTARRWTAGTYDPVLTNNNFTEETTLTLEADLGVSKADAIDPVAAGELLTYTITVDNLGPTQAPNTVVTDTLPGDVNYISATPQQGSCGEDQGVVVCELGELAPDASALITLVVETTIDGTLVNEVVVGAEVDDPIPGNDDASEETEVTPLVDLSISKVDAADPVATGDMVTYTITVDNAGPSTAMNVEMVDTLPVTVTFVSAATEQGTCGHVGGVVTCDLGNLALDASVPITLVVETTELGTLVNEAGVTSDTPDADSDNDSDSEETEVTPLADLSISKVDVVDPVVAGELVTYTITVDNAGPSTAENVEMVDTLPSGVTFVSATADQGTCIEAGGLVTCTLGDVLSGGSVEMTVVVEATVDGTLVNEAGVTSDTADADSDNDSDREETEVTPLVDLSVSKVDEVDPVVAGELVTYTITVDNAGPSTAENVEMVDALPSGVTFVSATADQGTCIEAGGLVTCTLGDVLSGGSVEVTLVVEATVDGTLVNEASVTSDTPDADLDNDSDSEETEVTPLADLSISKVDAVDPVTTGDMVTYIITVDNAGPSTAENVEMVDALPSGVTFVSAMAEQGTCIEAGGLVTCTLGDVLSGGSVDVTLVIEATELGTLVNEASVTSDTPDADLDNDSDSEETEVTPLADLSISKVDVVDPVVAGELVTYTITVGNAGPSTAKNVEMVDALPSGVTFVSATAEQGTCVHVGGVVTCTLGEILSGGSVEVTLVVETTVEAALVNEASVTSDTADADAGDNSDSEGTEVQAAPVQKHWIFLPTILRN